MHKVSGEIPIKIQEIKKLFEGKNPFDGKQTDEKGLPAGGTDQRGATVMPKKSTKKVEEETEF